MDFPPNRHKKDSGRAPETPPRGSPPRRTSYARLYHAEVGGEGGLPQDRDVLVALRRVAAQPVVPAAENRAFVNRAVAYLARSGVRQFLDIGAGPPAWGNVHDIAARFQPTANVVYVDNDPEVVDRWRDCLPERGRSGAVEADLRRPEELLAASEVRSLIDLTEPTGLMLGIVPQMVADEDDPAGLVGALVDALAPGSFLVLSQVTGDAQAAQTVAEVLKIMAAAGVPITMRSREEISGFFDRVDLVEPGTVNVADWRPVRTSVRRSSGWYYGGVGRKP